MPLIIGLGPSYIISPEMSPNICFFGSLEGISSKVINQSFLTLQLIIPQVGMKIKQIFETTTQK